MKFKSTRGALAAACLAAGLCAAPSAWATNGYFPHGYGIKAKGMGGVSTALAEDALGGATNPAKMVFVGSRLDLGLEWFSPHRDVSRVGGPAGSVDSDKTSFFVPEVGYNRMLGEQLALGITVYGNGGMNTSYPAGGFNCGPGADNALCGNGELGVDLMQLVLAPTVAYKLTPQHALGASLLLGYQIFEANGLQAFEGLSSVPGSVTNRSYDSATGVGLRLGYMGRINDALTVGAAWSSKINMGRFDKYSGLFAGGGDFDIPSNWSLGVAYTPAPGWTVAFDVQRINYSDVSAVHNDSSAPQPLGSAGGPGFGWQDVNVYKLGVAWKMPCDCLTLRAGYNRGDSPVRAQDVSFNILAPGVMKEHYTLGLTWHRSAKDEVNAFVMTAPRQSVTGPSFLGGSETIRMRQFSLGVGWSMKF